MPEVEIRADVRTILAELRRGLEAIYGDRLVRLVLFGSHARGEAREDSDIDVMVVLQGPVDFWEEMKRCSEFRAAVCLEHDVCISCLYMPESRFQGEQSPLLLNVHRDGVAL